MCAQRHPSSKPSRGAGELAGKRLCVVGMGLMGGSLAMALAQHVAALRGVDPRPETAARARELLPSAEMTSSLAEGVQDADIVVLAAPVRTNLKLVRQLGPLLTTEAVVFDLSSTKRAMVEAMNGLPEHVLAVGGHPMCGKERGGIGHADAQLYRGHRFVLCETLRTRRCAMDLAEAMVRAVGAKPLRMDPTLHDQVVARVSHLPYLLSAALVASTSALSEEQLSLAASGYRDVSRLAASDPDMMVDVLLTNTTHVKEAIDAAQTQLAQLAQLIGQGSTDELRASCAAIQRDRTAWAQQRATDEDLS